MTDILSVRERVNKFMVNPWGLLLWKLRGLAKMRFTDLLSPDP